jgi:hypothetical protein
MSSGLAEYIKNMDVFDYIGLIAAAITIIAFITGGIHTLFGHLFRRSQKSEIHAGIDYHDITR